MAGRRRRPSVERVVNASDWLCGGGLDDSLDSDAGLAAEIGLNTGVRNNVLASLRRDAPPRHADGVEQAAALVARWKSSEPTPPAPINTKPPSPGALRAPAVASSVGPLRSASAASCGSAVRSASRGGQACGDPAAGRPPMPLRSRGNSPLPSPKGGHNPVPALAPGAAEATDVYRSASGPAGSGKNDAGLVSSMAGRLAQVERLNQQLTSKVSLQNQEIDKLKAELEAVRKCQGAGEDDAAPSSLEARALRLERDQLRQQLEDMKKFLDEYGLTWVPRSPGDDTSSPDADAAPLAAAANVAPAAKPVGTFAARHCRQAAAADARGAEGGALSVDIKVLRSRIEGLNALVEEEAQHAVNVGRAGGSNVAKLAADGALPVPLTFFQDGVKLGERAFMPYNIRPAQDLIKEVLDGFFPRCLSESHPDGVQLHVVDRTGNAFVAWFREFARQDPDLCDGGDRLRPRCGQAVHAPSDNKSAAENFLAKLPERVISKNGNVCNVRGALAEKLGVPAAAPKAPSCGAPGAVGESGGGAAQKEVNLLASGRDPSAPSAKLQVKLEGGQRVKLCMEITATVGELWNALVKWRAQHALAPFGADGRQYILRTAFPPCSYTDMSQTLAAASLTPTATLFVSCEQQ
eukprot:TRINITY_DN41804_c0_g1_i1.p1 TRINITY_DN41804_c0_g1~~TRINITY_DN41804_c0_g1_i1.p1  ORF type:complete len:635 (+),score=132.69 TRINITY_DN41804_c0_g1_i1:73-1977(+)